ncbi:hypothetical protein OB955_24360 [Halobacteria archaeon AArc-m2/3/4]|uniref:Uncharacterized protein n=1 Tax=Natronoglomus mannanivorans TaxID=2979990 RepID=A0AAP3E3R9_9EURY|nr:hypothetical protein [Halobacteria archaeon AArc-xg1-1]MCU4975818.1 hypothetical protein [Halobacteria archaeon AArc-m2/3/4]
MEWGEVVNEYRAEGETTIDNTVRVATEFDVTREIQYGTPFEEILKYVDGNDIDAT